MNGLGISEIEKGISAGGAWDYYNNLNTRAIDKAKAAVLDLNQVKNVFHQNWQGQAEVNFEKNMDNAAKVVEQELDKVSKLIESLITELVETWAEQDKEMVQEENIIHF